MADEPKPEPDRDAIEQFLSAVTPVTDGPIVLTAIPPEGGRTQTETFFDVGAAAGWAEARNAAGANLYWTVNVVREAIDKKPSKPDIEHARYLHVDVDPRKPPRPDMSADELAQWNDAERARIEGALADFEPTPTVVVDSGGGYQALWRLDELFYVGGTAERWTDIEAYTRQLQKVLGGDNCFNIDRILRVAGTVNWPDGKKLKKGRIARRAMLAGGRDEAYSLHDFTPAPEDGAKVRTGPGAAVELPDAIPPADLDLLPEGLDARARMLIAQGDDPDDVTRYTSRSEAMWFVACELVRAGCNNELIAAILLDQDLPISAHCRSKGDKAREYAARQIERARAAVEADGEPFQTDKDGKPYPNQHNIRLALTKMGVRVRYNRFADRVALTGLEGFGPHLDDAALTRMRLRIDEEHRLKVGKEFFCDVVADAARRDDFHPVVDYLAGLTWDGTPRLDGWMTTYLQADDGDYTRAVGTLMLVAAVRRVRQPGCKFDEMVVLESEQGKAKSSALAVLAVKEDWFSDDLPLNAKAQVVIEQTQGRWIIEAGELKGMKGRDVEHLKNFLSRRRDSSRMAYERLSQDVPRHFIIVGTTNDDNYLSDSTGNRRFWPVRVGDIDLDALARDRDQLWAEAAAQEATGASIRLDRALWQAAALEQDERRTVDPLVPVLADVFGGLNGKVRSKDVWDVIGTPIGLRTPELERRLGAAVRELGFERKHRRFGGGPEWAYLRGTEEERARRILVVWVPGENGIGGAWDAYLEGDDLPGRQEAMELERSAHGDGPY